MVGTAFTLIRRPLATRENRLRLSQAFISRDGEFFELFEQAGWNIQYATELLAPMLDHPELELAGDLDSVTTNGRRITRDIVMRLNRTYVTRIDRRDMLRLAKALDDTIELTENVSESITLYKVDRLTREAQELTQLLLLGAREVAEAIPRTRSMDDVSTHVAELRRLDQEGNRVMRDAIAALFVDEADPTVVLRWKDIYTRLGRAIRAMRQISQILETIVMKNV
jgi:uncharacterized protein Yka (UPF0111/DUF47 family)